MNLLTLWTNLPGRQGHISAEAARKCGIRVGEARGGPVANCVTPGTATTIQRFHLRSMSPLSRRCAATAIDVPLIGERDRKWHPSPAQADTHLIEVCVSVLEWIATVRMNG